MHKVRSGVWNKNYSSMGPYTDPMELFTIVKSLENTINIVTKDPLIVRGPSKFSLLKVIE